MWGYQRSHSRKKERAKKEREVIKACAMHLDEKITNLDMSRRMKSQQLDGMVDDYMKAKQNGEDEIILQRMNSRYEMVKAEYQDQLDLLGLFMSTQNSLYFLLSQVDALMQLEWYKYLIRIIPEKKLPKAVRSEKVEDMHKVRQLTEDIVQKIKDRIISEIHDRNEQERMLRKIEDTANIMTHNRNTTESVSEIEKAAQQRERMEMPLPLSHDIEETEENKNLNNV